ncbi:GNAT family N-acetyltransferase [Piscinibacter sakaiensis]|uniref:GNAT family N-acetyltransferase n=1 Tax=Piscinibacter sakaiensis TaxID=1547922 RepID=UPI003AAC770A
MVLIEPIDHRNPSVAKQIHQILSLAHAQEADILSVVDHAPFNQHHETIQARDDYFLGAFKLDQLIGSVSFLPDDEPDQFLVTSLVVHPLHQREGVARSLMVHMLALVGGYATAVAAGADNKPALSLYRDLGFVEYRSGTIGAGALALVKLRRARSAGSQARSS